MDAPLGVTFFKKVELYQKICSLDTQTEIVIKGGGLKPLWPLEKKILVWTYKGHKHLGSPINTSHLDQKSKESKLKAFKITLEEMRYINPIQVLENLVVHGFAKGTIEDFYSHGKNENEIYFTREGLLVGEILNELNDSTYRLSYNIWSILWGHWGGFILIIFFLISLFKLVVLPLLKVIIPIIIYGGFIL